MIHIGSRKTLRTLCGKSINSRIWWQNATYVRQTGARREDPMGYCQKCLRALKAKKGPGAANFTGLKANGLAPRSWDSAKPEELHPRSWGLAAAAFPRSWEQDAAAKFEEVTKARRLAAQAMNMFFAAKGVTKAYRALGQAIHGQESWCIATQILATAILEVETIINVVEGNKPGTRVTPSVEQVARQTDGDWAATARALREFPDLGREELETPMRLVNGKWKPIRTGGRR